MDLKPPCELCNSEAGIYCPSDSAFLCWNCDLIVHSANILVTRHVRHIVCTKCNGFACEGFHGIGIRQIQQLCGPCLLHGHDVDSSPSSSSSSSSDCISSTESCESRQKKMKESSVSAEFSGEVSSTEKARSGRSGADSPVRDVLRRWFEDLGVVGRGTAGVPAMAVHALRACSDELAGTIPFQVSHAASLWIAVRMCRGGAESTWQVLRRLEGISGVPAKQILLAESEMTRVLRMKTIRRRRRQQYRKQKEGWAEC